MKIICFDFKWCPRLWLELKHASSILAGQFNVSWNLVGQKNVPGIWLDNKKCPQIKLATVAMACLQILSTFRACSASGQSFQPLGKVGECPEIKPRSKKFCMKWIWLDFNHVPLPCKVLQYLPPPPPGIRSFHNSRSRLWTQTLNNCTGCGSFKHTRSRIFQRAF